MHQALISYLKPFDLSGVISEDVPAFLRLHGREWTAEHCGSVARLARQLAERWGGEMERAELAGWLHDISAIVPGAERLQLADGLGLEVLPEERLAPVLIHQKLSVVIAQEVFGLDDPQVLSAIGCHTTLKADCSAVDKIVFVADKLAWDQAGEPPYYREMAAALEESLEQAALVYLEYLWQKRDSLPALHPWELAAYHQLLDRIAKS